MEDFEEVTQGNKKWMLLKHSLTCPISGSANQAYESFSEQSEMPLYRLYVQDSRELSNYIAKKYKVQHESPPQVIKFENDKPSWHTSHFDITVDNLIRHI